MPREDKTVRRTSGGSLIRLVREDAEASLCGIPSDSLGGLGMFAELVCAACLEWFEKRRSKVLIPNASRAHCNVSQACLVSLRI